MVICRSYWHHEDVPERLDAAAAGATARLLGNLVEPDHFVSSVAEDATDAAAARPWSRLTPSRVAQLDELLRPVAMACAAALPFPSSRPAGVDGKLTTHAGPEPSS